jgi:hypothetical protein
MKLNFKNHDEEFCLELFQDAFFRYSAQIIRIRDTEEESVSCESIIIDTCEGNIEVYDNVDFFGGRELVVSEKIDDDEISEKNENEILLFMKEFLIRSYLNKEK